MSLEVVNECYQAKHKVIIGLVSLIIPHMYFALKYMAAVVWYNTLSYNPRSQGWDPP